VFAAVGHDFLLLHGIAVDDNLHRHLATVAEAGALQVPVGLLVEAAAADGLGRFGRLGFQQRGHAGLQLHRAGLGQSNLQAGSLPVRDDDALYQLH
jgi:hypothetical protein